MPRGKLAGAGRELAAESVSEHGELVVRQKHFMGLAKPVWSPAELCTKLSKTAAGKWAAAMGGRDEDDPAHLWHGFVEERLSQELAFLGRSDDLVDRTRADSLPEPRSATLDHHLRQDAAKAVAHDDHSVEGRVRAIGIEDSTRPPQGLPQQVGRVGDRVPARVGEQSRIETLFGVQGRLRGPRSSGPSSAGCPRDHG